MTSTPRPTPQTIDDWIQTSKADVDAELNHQMRERQAVWLRSIALHWYHQGWIDAMRAAGDRTDHS